ncbi:hypothetical protein CEB3_c33490 [Peptococcaceae bacterium CEB3]|nr:hypothetical protein CEB3_c33490 [Peptococcaceae bacterium CEB3]
MIEHRGVNYDVGTVMGVNWRPDYHPQTTERELEIIKNDLHCNAVGISGKDINRVVVTAEAALSLGLEAWLNPSDWTNKPPEPTLAYITEAAKAAQPLHERYPGKVVLSVGSEFTLFMQGIVPGKTFMERINTVFKQGFVKSGQHNRPLNDFLAKVNEAVRSVFDGPVMYRSLSFEEVDWSNFDLIGVDHYWAEKIKDRYIDMVKPLFTHGKPVINTGFGFNTTNAPIVGMASTMGDIPFFSILLHQLPVVGRFVRSKLKVVQERDEALQAERLTDNLKLLDRAGFSGAFIDTFIFSHYPYSDTPKYDLDRASSSLVKYFEGGRHGTTYPDMTWEPKEAFKAVAEYYGKQTED